MLKKKLLIYTVVLSLAGLMVNCEGFLTGGILDEDPGRVTEVPLLEQLVNTQSVTYGFIEGDIGIFSVMFMQQLAGVQHQYTSYEVYSLSSEDFGYWSQVYQEGGLIDMDEIAERAESEDPPLRTVAGIAKMHEALMIATAADVWGDIPYSQAAQVDEYPMPVYDDQSVVHDAVLDLLDEAIADFTAGQDDFDGSYDFAFDGDTDKWIAAAHTLKARILLNWAEVKPGNYALALAEAQDGIGSTADNWQATHNDKTGEENIFYQFKYLERFYVRVGAQIVDMLQDDNDPRLQVYFDTTAAGIYRGSKHNECYEGASWLNEETIGGAASSYDLVTWEENQFIIAECQQHANQDAAALATLNATLAGIETRWVDDLGGVSIPTYSGLTDTPLLEAIMHEKYKALFLNPQVWSDWKRTGYPVLTLAAGYTEVPRRFLYPDDEENANANFPGVLGLFVHNENDPN